MKSFIEIREAHRTTLTNTNVIKQIIKSDEKTITFIVRRSDSREDLLQEKFERAVEASLRFADLRMMLCVDTEM